MYTESDKFGVSGRLGGRHSSINTSPVIEGIKNKKIKLLDKIDGLINQGFTYEDILKSVNIHKSLND